MRNCELGNVWSTKCDQKTFSRRHTVSISYWVVWQFPLPLYTTFFFSGCFYTYIKFCIFISHFIPVNVIVSTAVSTGRTNRSFLGYCQYGSVLPNLAAICASIYHIIHSLTLTLTPSPALNLTLTLNLTLISSFWRISTNTHNPVWQFVRQLNDVTATRPISSSV